jgi:hypothetical protein
LLASSVGCQRIIQASTGCEHDRAVPREQLVVPLRGQELQTRPGQLGSHRHRQQPADHEEHTTFTTYFTPSTFGSVVLANPRNWLPGRTPETGYPGDDAGGKGR